MATRLARQLVLAGLLVLPVGLVACGSDSTSSSSPATSDNDPEVAESSEGAEEYEIVPDSEVTAGLAELATMGAAVVAAVESGQGSPEAVDAMYEKWASFEGTIKQNEVDLYLTLEDSLASLRAAAESNDGPAASAALGDLSEASSAYLAKHP